MVDLTPDLPDPTGPPEPPGPPDLVLDAADGPHPSGLPMSTPTPTAAPTPPLIDVPGGLLLATDVDGDGHVDAATVVGPPPSGPHRRTPGGIAAGTLRPHRPRSSTR